ncbi:ABC transporter permease [Leifsonia sp. LS1]|uniref:ABC transporter permease n=1 Tax=unclassified Leifsonia TaxID=2663824 RepID=UPI001CC0483B|nr:MULTISPECIES: ABC transporter permease [unclassified Leifsonia]UAJ79151.1 ABC transporter permease [Leifsonia sp. ZF2019]GIT78879.1 ABC transporter permease [Leifsonia sp. LS1]
MSYQNAPEGDGPLIVVGGPGGEVGSATSVAGERPREAAAPTIVADGTGAVVAHTPFLSRRWVRITGGLVLPAIILVVWQVASTSGAFTSAQLPSPAMVWNAAIDLAQRGLLGLYVAISTQRVLLGFACGAALGLVLGAVVGLSRLADILFSSTLAAIRAVPSLAWVPLLILWFKIGEDSKIILIAIGSFFPVYTTVAASLKHVDRHLVEAGRAFGLNGIRLFTTVQLPSVLPSVISGLRLALAQAWLFLVAAELIASSMGLGFLLSDSQNNGRTDRLFLAIILLALLGKLTDSLVGLFERWANRRWA